MALHTLGVVTSLVTTKESTGEMGWLPALMICVESLKQNSHTSLLVVEFTFSAQLSRIKEVLGLVWDDRKPVTEVHNVDISHLTQSFPDLWS